MATERVFIGLPCYTDACSNAFGAKRAFLENGLIGRFQFAVEPAVSSSLPYGFNNVYAKALAGDFDWFVMLHSDIVPCVGFAGILLDLACEHDADVVSAAAPIKSGDGVFSTGVGDRDNVWGPRYRFTAHQLKKMPETFSIADTDSPDGVLLINTGCFIANLRKPWVRDTDENGDLKFCFDMRHRIHVHENGKLEPNMEPEDWRFSRHLESVGAKVLATKKVPVIHFGTKGWKSTDVWGEEIDPLARQAYVERLVSEHGYWIENLPDGREYDGQLCKAMSELVSGKVYDLGCGRGWYVMRLREMGRDVEGMDGSPRTVEVANCRVCDLALPQTDKYSPADWVITLEVGEHIPAAHENVFLDNITGLARKGVIVSWAPPGQQGTGHVNCRSLDWVVEKMAERGFVFRHESTEKLRAAAGIGYFKTNLCVFTRDSAASLGDDAYGGG